MVYDRRNHPGEMPQVPATSIEIHRKDLTPIRGQEVSPATARQVGPDHLRPLRPQTRPCQTAVGLTWSEAYPFMRPPGSRRLLAESKVAVKSFSCQTGYTKKGWNCRGWALRLGWDTWSVWSEPYAL